MAHHVDKQASAVADRVGPFSAIFMLGGAIAAVWLIIKHPKTALSCVAVALAFAFVSSNPTQHPLLGLLAIGVGFCLADPKKGTKK